MTDRQTLLTAEQTRLACRGGRFSEQTSGLASGFAQANLVVLLLLAVSYRCLMPGPLLGLAGAIKLYPVENAAVYGLRGSHGDEDDR